MPPPSDGSSAPAVERDARLSEQGNGYKLVLWENGKSKKGVAFTSKNDLIPEIFGWRDEEGVTLDDATYSHVTQGSTFVFEGNRYPVEVPTPFEKLPVDPTGAATSEYLPKGTDELTLPQALVDAITNHNIRDRQPCLSPSLRADVSNLFTHKREPDFLTFGLGQNYYSDESTRTSIQKLMAIEPVCVAGVSGAGKTRTVLEILSNQYGIYFSAADYINTSQDEDPDKPCSKDLAWVANDSSSDIQKDIYPKTVQRLHCAVCARILVFEKTKEAKGEDFNPVDWVLMQLYPPVVWWENKQWDIFEAVTVDLFADYSKIHEIELKVEDAVRGVQNVLKCIVVDEAQVAMQQNRERYDNVNKTKTHPFLYAVIRCLWSFGKNAQMCPILCGTGISIMKMSSIAVSAVGAVDGLQNQQARDPVQKYRMQVPISTVLEPKEINDIVKKILVPELCGNHRLGLWGRLLTGRPRTVWGFLSLAITKSNEGVDGVFENYRKHMTSAEGQMGNATTTLYSCVKKAMERQATGETSRSQSIGAVVTQMIVNWLTGQTPAMLEEEEKVDVMVDCGVCILERKEEEGGTKLVARLREPLVVQAFLMYFKDDPSDPILSAIMGMLETATEPCSQGFLFELLFYFAFRKGLDGLSLRQAGFAPSDKEEIKSTKASSSTPADKGSSEKDKDMPCAFLDEVCDIPLESIGNSLLRLPDKASLQPTECQSGFLECHRAYLTSKTSRPRPRAAATPAKKDGDDIVVVAPTAKHVLIFLIQCKLEKETDYLKAAQTTYPELLLHQSKRPKIDKKGEDGRFTNNFELPSANAAEYAALKDLLGEDKWGDHKVCVVQLVVAYPALVSKLGETRWISTRRCADSDELSKLLKERPTENDQRRLLVVVKKDRLRALLGERIFSRLQEVKKKDKAKDVEAKDGDSCAAFVPTSIADLVPYEG